MSKPTVRSTLASLTLLLGIAGFTACIPGIQISSSSSMPSRPAPTASQAAAPPPSSPDAPQPSVTPAPPPAPSTNPQDLRAIELALEEAAKELDMKTTNEEYLARASDQSGDNQAPVGARCTAAVATAIASGIPTATKLSAFGMGTTIKTTLGDMQATVCDVLLASAKTWKARIAAAKRGTSDRAAAPYKALGITGDKLEFLVDNIDVALWGVGGNELTTAQQAKQAAVIFIRVEGTTEWTLRRYRWNGNKSAGMTEETFVRNPGLASYR